LTTLPALTPQLVIFDCDGVLVDSERLSHEVLCTMLAELGLRLGLQQAYEHFMGLSTERCLQTITRLLGRAPALDFMESYRDRSFEAFRAGLAAVPGVADVLQALPMPYCVASNGPHEKMRFTLGLTGLLPRFAGRTFSAEDVARPPRAGRDPAPASAAPRLRR